MYSYFIFSMNLLFGNESRDLEWFVFALSVINYYVNYFSTLL